MVSLPSFVSTLHMVTRLLRPISTRAKELLVVAIAFGQLVILKFSCLQGFRLRPEAGRFVQ